MRLSLINLSLLNLSEKEEMERTFRINANEDDDHLVQGGAVILITRVSARDPLGLPCQHLACQDLGVDMRGTLVKRESDDAPPPAQP